MVAGWRGQREVVRIAAHRVPLLEDVGRSLHELLLAQAVRIARIAGDELLQALEGVLEARVTTARRCRVHKATGRVTAELFALVGERDLAGSGVTRRQLQLEGMRRDELGPEEHCAEHDLDSLEEVVAHDHYADAAVGGALARTHRFYEGMGYMRATSTATAAAARRRAADGRCARVRGGHGAVDATCCATPMLRVVVHEHVLGDGEERAVHAYLRADDYLEATHVARVACVLQAILVAFQKEFEKKS